MLIGRKGERVEELQTELQNLIGRRINIKIEEINRPEIVAQLVAEDIGEQLAKRASFRRTMKRAMEQTMEAGAKGIKIQLAGRLGGAEMARREKSIAGSIPLSTLRAKIDYGFAEAMIAQGHIGIQVWINQGMYDEDQPMAMMPKRVKHRKSQRGRIKGDATRGNRVVFGDFGLQAMQAGWIQRANDRGRAYRGAAVSAHRRPAVRARLPAQADHLHPLGNPHGQGQGRAGILGRGGQARHGVVRNERVERGSGADLLYPLGA